MQHPKDPQYFSNGVPPFFNEFFVCPAPSACPKYFNFFSSKYLKGLILGFFLEQAGLIFSYFHQLYNMHNAVFINIHLDECGKIYNKEVNRYFDNIHHLWTTFYKGFE
jgi:hypothetical protein